MSEDQVKKPEVEEVVTPKTDEAEQAEKGSKKDKKVVVEAARVKVVPNFSGLRHIAGEWYEFEKDKEIEVSAEAKRVLKAGHFINIA